MLNQNDPAQNDPAQNDPAQNDPAQNDPAQNDPAENEAALLACLMEIERHIGTAGWEQPPRLFALVPTAALRAAEPGLAGGAADHGEPADQLSAVEQEDFDPGSDLTGALAVIMWPDAVVGCAVSLVRSFLPAGSEDAIPDEPAAAEAHVQAHPQREDVRAVVGVLRSGGGQAVARLAAHPEDLLSGPDLMPGVVAALARSLEPADHEHEPEA